MTEVEEKNAKETDKVESALRRIGITKSDSYNKIAYYMGGSLILVFRMHILCVSCFSFCLRKSFQQ